MFPIALSIEAMVEAMKRVKEQNPNPSPTQVGNLMNQMMEILPGVIKAKLTSMGFSAEAQGKLTRFVEAAIKKEVLKVSR